MVGNGVERLPVPVRALKKLRRAVAKFAEEAERESSVSSATIEPIRRDYGKSVPYGLHAVSYHFPIQTYDFLDD